MAWSTPRTWAAEQMTSTNLNAHVRDNLNALKTAATTSTAKATANTTFNNTSTTIASFSYTFDSGTTYLLGGSIYSITPASATGYQYDLELWVGATCYGKTKALSDGTTTQQSGMAVFGTVASVSGSQTVALKIIASTGSGHTVNASSTTPSVVWSQPANVV